MPTTLSSQISELASGFASAILTAIRGASLEELLGERGVLRRGPGRPRGSSTMSTKTSPRMASASGPTRRPGRLARRSPAQIARALANVVTLVKKSPKGLRSEQIRDALKMQRKEMPRVIKEGLAKKQLTSKGQKRSTVYSAA